MLQTEEKQRLRLRIAALTVLALAMLLTWGIVTAASIPVDEGAGAPPGRRVRIGPRPRAGAQPQAGSVVTVALSVTPLGQIQGVLDQVESTTLYQYVGDLSGEWPVTVGGEPFTLTTRYTYSGEPVLKATQFVSEHLAAQGLAVGYHYWLPDRPPNVIGELPGERRPEEIVILSAHLDSYTRVNPAEIAPGADDNASGAATVLLAADLLTQYEWDCTLRFALWTGEEQGLLGSGAYAEAASSHGEEIAGVLNLDMMGWDGEGGPDIDLHANSSVTGSVELAELFAAVVVAYDLNLVPEIVVEGIGSSDHASFWDYGYPAVLGIEDYYPARHDFNPYYHTEQDRLEHLDMNYFAEFAKAAIGTFAHMGCLPYDQLDRQIFLPVVMQEG